MIDFDANGIHQNVYGERTFKRIAEFWLDGQRVFGGVYIGQSTETDLLVDRMECVERTSYSGGPAIDMQREVWKPTGVLLSVPMNKVILIFEPKQEGNADESQ